MKHTRLLALFIMAFVFNFAFGEGKIIINSHPQPEYGKAIPFYKVPGTGRAMSLVVSGGRLYALEKDGLSIYNISNPKEPKRVGFVGGMGNVRQLKVKGDTAFLTSRQCGLWAVDVSDETNPKILSNFDGVELSTGLDVVGDVAVLGHRVYGVQCVDVSNPSAMRHLSSIRTDESQSVLYRNGLIFSGDWAGGEITVIDASNILDLKVLSKMSLDGYGDGFVIRGNTLFASTGQHKKSGDLQARHGAGHGLDIFDISNPLSPRKISKTTFPSFYFGPNDYWTPRVAGNYCFAADQINGVFILDISDLKNPKILGNLILPKRDPENPKIAVPFKQITDPKIPQGDPVSSIAVGDGVLYIAGTYTGIYVAELPDIAKIENRDEGVLPDIKGKSYDASESGFVSSGAELVNPIRAVAIDGDIAYAANLWDGLKIFKLCDDKIELVGVKKIPCVFDVKKSGNKLYTAEGKDGIGVYEIVSPMELREIGRLKDLGDNINFVEYIWAFDGCDTVVATCAGSILYFVNVSDPTKPRLSAKQKGPQILYGNYASQKLVKNRYFSVNRHVGGNMVFDLGDAENPKLVSSDTFPMCHQSGSVAAMGDKFITMRCGGYAFIDPENIVPTKNLKRHKFPSQTEELPDVEAATNRARAEFPKNDFEGLVFYDVESGRLSVANRMYRVCRVYDFSDGKNPTLLDKYELKSHPNVPAFWRGRLVLPCGYSGLLLESKKNPKSPR